MFIVEIDDCSPKAKKVIKTLITHNFVNVVDNNEKEKTSPYNLEFVKMVKQADKGKRTKINTSNIWESILSK